MRKFPRVTFSLVVPQRRGSLVKAVQLTGRQAVHHPARPPLTPLTGLVLKLCPALMNEAPSALRYEVLCGSNETQSHCGCSAGRAAAAGCPRQAAEWWGDGASRQGRPTESTGPLTQLHSTHTHTQSWMFPFSTASPLYFHPQLSSEFHTAFLDACFFPPSSSPHLAQQ